MFSHAVAIFIAVNHDVVIASKFCAGQIKLLSEIIVK